MKASRRLALLVDGDNAEAALLAQIMAEVGKYGSATIRRVYGDWTEPQMKGWKETLHTYAMQPIQQFRYTQGKNATDSALIIDAMDILYSAEVDGFCIASSDSDYTRLATRIGEKNLFVLGIGRKNTPQAFVKACAEFVYTESLQPEAKAKPITPITPSQIAVKAEAKPAANSVRLKKLLQKAFDSATQDEGWVNLAAMGSALRQVDPEFDPSKYGHKQLSQLVGGFPDLIESQKRKTNGGGEVLYVRLKKK